MWGVEHMAILQAKRYSIIQSVLEAEHELETVLLGVRVPVGPVPVASVVGLVLDFPRRDAEGNRLVRLGRDLSIEPLAYAMKERGRDIQ